MDPNPWTHQMISNIRAPFSVSFLLWFKTTCTKAARNGLKTRVPVILEWSDANTICMSCKDPGIFFSDNMLFCRVFWHYKDVSLWPFLGCTCVLTFLICRKGSATSEATLVSKEAYWGHPYLVLFPFGQTFSFLSQTFSDFLKKEPWAEYIYIQVYMYILLKAPFCKWESLAKRKQNKIRMSPICLLIYL